MFHTYANSLQCPIRVRSYNDYCTLLSDRSETHSRCSCPTPRSRCCCCCYSTPSSYSSFVKPKVSINPGFLLYGLRQSTLIQWPRRLLVDVGVNVGGSRLLGSCNSHVYSSCGGSRRNQRFRLRACDESKECCPDDVEAMISFLSEELIDEDRNWNLVSRVEEKRKVRCGGVVNRGNVRRVNSYGDGKNKRAEGVVGRQEYKRNGIREDVKLEEKYGCEHCGRTKKNSQLESETRRGSELVVGESIGKVYRRKEEREVRPRRTKSSSCSSYYSLASSGEFESDTEDDEEEEDVEFRRENLRSSEKKFVEQSTKGMKSRKEVSQMHSRRKRDESSSGVGSSYHKQVFEEVENSNQAVALNQRRRRKQSSQTGVKVSESTGNYKEDVEIHEIHVNDAETNSQNQKIFGEMEDNRVHSIVIDSERENIENSQQQLKERLGARYSSEERVSEMRRRTEYSSSQEEGINVLQKISEATNNQQTIENSQQQLKERLGARYNREERLSEMHRRTQYSSSQEEGINVLQNFPEATNNQQNIKNSQQQLKERLGARYSSEERVSEMRRRTEYSSSQEGGINVLQNSPEAINNQQPPVEERISKEDGMRMSTERFSESSNIHDIDIRNTHVLQREEQSRIQEVQAGLVSGLRSERRQQDYHVDPNPSQKMQSDRMVDLVSKEMQGSETTLVPPSSQLVSRGSGKSYGTGGAFIQEISQGTSETGYPTAFEHPGPGAFVNSQSAGEPMGFTTHEDALGSAQRLEQSSEKFVGEFVKKAKHEASTSATDERRAESNQLKRQDSRRSSGGSGAKGPSDDLWVTDSAQGTPQPVATEGKAAEGNAIFKRSGRSLWGVIADIARLRWGSRAGSPDSSAKPTGKSSPNESVSSATWFSGREHDGSSDDNTKADRVVPQEAASPHQLEVSQTSSRSRFESSDATELKRLEGVVSSSLSSTILEGGSAYYRMPSTSGNQNVGVDEEEGRDFEFRVSETASAEVPMRLPSRNLKRSPAVKDPSESSPTELSSDQNVTVGEGRRYKARVSEMDAVERPLLFPDPNLRSPVVKEPSQFRPSMVSGSSSLREQVEQQQPLSAKSQEETGSTSTDSPLKQRKLQRNKQVVRDSFEEWEEAYKVENERRTVDEIFMREALVEAKKAADIWEVPVGAVLVHDGKIIARGFNLVEDLRDSTAHAEMICIREGSKVLRSWRLADTTLYVTLEPCPMCAGAILQARVKTLVWGAPNKLLGADGSWIRLFPGGEGNGTEVSEKPPPPVHPFHPKMTIRRGVLESECAQTMQQFFQLRRKKKEKNSDPPAPTDHHHHHPSKLLNKMHQILPFVCL